MTKQESEYGRVSQLGRRRASEDSLENVHEGQNIELLFPTIPPPPPPKMAQSFIPTWYYGLSI